LNSEGYTMDPIFEIAWFILILNLQ